MLGKNRAIIPELVDAFDGLTRRVRDLVDRTDPEVLASRPVDGGWSAAQCIDHLNVSARLYIEPLGEAIEAARRDGVTGPRPDGRTLLGRLFAWMTEPPARFKTRTFEKLEPQPELDPRDLADSFAEHHGHLVALLEGAADVDRKRVKVRSVLDARLKLSLDDWFAFIAAHARRHLWQAERAIEAARAGTTEP